MAVKRKIRVGILFGGRSAEHEVSLQSAKNVINALDKKKYEPVLISIDKAGKWHLQDSTHFLLHPESPKLVSLVSSSQNLVISPWKNDQASNLDVVFPVLHGSYGEDGTIQGFLKLANLPFVGAGVLGSAIGMDKDISKRLLQNAKVPVAKFLVFREGNIDFKKITKQLGLPVFVKPANLGSSIGVSKASDKKTFRKAVSGAFQYDTKILVEEFISGREIECSVLGNEKPTASLPGEIVPNAAFYSYEAKYIDANGAKLFVPADLSKAVAKKIQEMAIKTFQTLSLEGMARVDFFLTNKGKIYVNEVNTIPGFTKNSMYPKLWEVSGISYPELLDILISLALARFKKEQKLKTTK